MIQRFKLLILLILLFSLSSIYSKPLKNSSFYINEINFNESLCEYEVTILNSSNNESDNKISKSIYFIIPEKEFVVTTSDNKSVKIEYSGIIRGYHTCRVVILKDLSTTLKNKKSNKKRESFRFKLNFKKDRLQNFVKKKDIIIKEDDDFVKQFVSNYNSKTKLFKLDKSSIISNENNGKGSKSRSNREPFEFIDGLDYFKLFVKEEGIYHLDNYEMRTNDINLSGVDPKTIRVFNEGVEIPIFVYGEADGVFDNYDYIEFYGERNLYRYREEFPNRYLDTETDENIYFLTFGGDEFGLRLIEENGAIITEDDNEYISPDFYKDKIHFEEDINRNNLRFIPELANPDVWFYKNVIGQRNVDIPFNLNNIAPDDSVKIKYSVITALTLDNHFETYDLNLGLNYANLEPTQWVGPYPFIDSSYTNAGNLNAGSNTFKLYNPNAPEIWVYLNWFEVTYNSLFSAVNNKLDFNQGGIRQGPVFISPRDTLYNFEVNGFTNEDVSVYKKGISKLANFIVTSSTNSSGSLVYKVHFQDYISAETNYLIVAEEDKKFPTKIEQKSNFEKSLIDTDNKARYLIIANEEFIENEDLLSYISYKEENQFTEEGDVKLVSISQILNQFSNGEYSGDGLNEFFRYINLNWEQAPEFVTLIGTSSFNHIATQEADFIPVMLFQHYRYGSVASDYKYTIMDNSSPAPQFYLGRIPVVNNDQLSNYFEKVLAYEDHSSTGLSYQKWMRELEILTDEVMNDSLNYVIYNNFEKNNFIDKMLLWTNEEPYQGGTATLLEKMDRGLGVLNYFGHGSGEIWANSRLLTPDDVDDLTRIDYLPVIYAYTCFAGNFASKSGSAEEQALDLSSRLLLTKRKGGVAIIAPTGNSQFEQNFKIYKKILEKQQEETETLGELFTKAKYEFYLNHTVLDPNIGRKNLYQYLLLGDPTLKVNYSNKSERFLEVDNHFVSYNDTIKIAGLNNPDFFGNDWKGLIEIYNSGFNRISRIIIEDDDLLSDGRLAIVIPDSFACDSVSNPENYLTIRTFISRTEQTGVDENDFYTDYLDIFFENGAIGTQFLDFFTLPEQNTISEKDSIGFGLKAFNSSGFSEIKCYIDTGETYLSPRQEKFFPSPKAGSNKSRISNQEYRIMNEKRKINSKDKSKSKDRYNFDTVLSDFTEMPNSRYVSDLKIKNLPRNREISYYYHTVDNDGNPADSDVMTFIIPVGDLYHLDLSPTYLDSSYDRLASKTALLYALPKFSLLNYDSIQVSYYIIDENNNIIETLDSAYINLSVDGYNIIDSVTTSVFCNFPEGLNRYRVEINKDRKHTEFDEGGIPPYENNIYPYPFQNTGGYIFTNRFKVSENLGSELNGVHAAIELNDVSCEIFENSVGNEHYSVLEIDTIHLNENSFSLDMSSSLFDENLKSFGYNLKLFYNGSTLQNDNKAEVTNYQSLSDEIFIFYFNRSSNKWEKVDNAIFSSNSKQINTKSKTTTKKSSKNLPTFQLSNLPTDKSLYTISFETNKMGLFSILRTTDKTKPKIELSVEGQVFVDNGYISKTPKINSIIQDISGINPNSISVYIDGDLVDNSLIQLNDLNSVNNSIQLSINPTLTIGSHTVEIIASDNIGNMATLTKDLRVEDDFKIVYHGNYPNPFIYETVFCFKITKLARLVSLKIYTVSGRKIREFTRNNIINYSEIRWDGRDHKGEMVANGVYFYKLELKTGDKTYSETGKIAKIRK